MNVIFEIIFTLIQFLGRLLFDWNGWILVVGILAYLIWQNTRKQRWVSDSSYALLMLEVPRDNDKRELSAEQLFASLHGILRPKQELLREGAIQEHISFEIASVGQRIRFYIWTPHHLKNFVEGQVYAQYPSVNILEITEDYARTEQPEDSYTQSVELTLQNSDYLPIRTFNSFEVDPLGGITAVLAKLEENDEQVWIQVLARPLEDSWHRKGEAFINKVRNGRAGSSDVAGDFLASLQRLLRDFFVALWRPPEGDGGAGKKPEISDQQKAMAQAASDKISKLGYEVTIRLLHTGNDKNLARLRIQALVGAFKQFNDTTNSFKVKKTYYQDDALSRYKARLFIDKGIILNIEELASLYHLPHSNVETPSMVWANSRTAEPPSNLPTTKDVPGDQLSPLGTTNFRGHNRQFGLKRNDRGRHTYVVGQTGTGKSYSLLLLALSDIYHDHGFAVIDPHGDLATDVLRYIPEHRVKDVVYFNPSDTDFPIAFNPLEVTDPSLKNHISSEVVGALKRMFGYSWGPRLEYILRYTILALLDSPNSTLLGITRMLTEKDFRADVIAKVKDPVVRNFWVNEFASWNEKFASEAVAPILNKVGAFTANPLIRNIIGQPTSAFNVRAMMDEGKILIVNLSRGQVGEDNAATLGALMVTKIQLAAMSRASIARIEDRRPFQLYVDEFQNFATDSFAVILSEARKYGLNLTIANQYISQMPQEVRDAVFGNVGSIISFRVSADDAPYLAKYFAPTFEGEDLIKLNNRHFVISMSIDGEKVPAFTALSLNVPASESDFIPQIITETRNNFSSSRADVEAQINAWAEPKRGSEGARQPQAQANGGRSPRHSQQKPSEKAQRSTKQPQHVPKTQSHRTTPATEPAPDGKINHGEVIRLRKRP
ncbi:MAG: type IV secretion system DNA-binding domain-containing protein [Candidatus Saccharimonadales bacterium]